MMVPVVPSHVVSAPLAGTRVLCDTRTWELTRLRDDVAALWPLLDGATTVDTLARELAAESGLDADEWGRRLRSAFGALVEADLLTWRA